MIRFLFILQALFFLTYGIFSGLAFSRVSKDCDRAQAMAAGILISLPLNELSNVRVNQEI